MVTLLINMSISLCSYVRLPFASSAGIWATLEILRRISRAGGGPGPPPHNDETYRLQAATAATVFWVVELRTSYVCTQGVPSTTGARIFVTSGYVPRLYAPACSASCHSIRA